MACSKEAAVQEAAVVWLRELQEISSVPSSIFSSFGIETDLFSQ